MKVETTVGKTEFRQLYEEDSNVKQAAIWASSDDGCMVFQDHPVYTLTVEDLRYFVLLRAPTRIGYCMLVESLSTTYDLRIPVEVSVWVDWTVISNSLLSQHLLLGLLKEHDILFDACLSKYGVQLWRDFVKVAFDNGCRVGYLVPDGIMYYPNFKAFYTDRHVTWDTESPDTKIVIRKSHE